MPSAEQFLDDTPSADAFLDDSAEAFLDSGADSLPAQSPSLSVRTPLPASQFAVGLSGTPGPANALEAEQASLRSQRDTSIAAAREREASLLTPVQIQRLDTGTIAENLMTAPPGLEAPMTTPADVQKRFPQMSDGKAKIVAGVLQAGAGLWNFGASPVGLASMPVAAMAGAGGIVGAAGKAALGTFAVDAARAIPQLTAEFGTALGEGDPEKIARLATELTALGFVGAGATKGLTGAVRGIPAQEAGAVTAQARAAGMEQSAAALDQLAKQVETGPIERSSPLQAATSEARPSGELLSTPEALRRTQELQLSEAPRAATLEGMVKTASRFDDLLPREIRLQVDEATMQALEAYKLAKQRQAEVAARSEGGKLDTSGETFASVADTPAFQRTAEQQVSGRPLPPEPTTVRDTPAITSSTPLKDVEQLVRGQLERRDWVNAVATLGQAKAEVSRKVLDKLLGVSKEAVPLQAGERMIFNEIWEAALEKTGAKQAEPFKSSIVRDESGKLLPVFHGATQAFKTSEIKTPAFFSSDAEVAARFAKTREQFAGEENPRAHVKSAFINLEKPLVIDAQGDFAGNFQFGPKSEAFCKALENPDYDGAIIKNTRDEGDVFVVKKSSQVRAIPASAVSTSLVQRLEALKTPLDPTQISSTPFPQIARAVWNTSLDIAIAAVKAGQSLKAAIEAALSHLRKNAKGFDEAAVRAHMEKIVQAEGQAVAGARAATEVMERPQIKTPTAAASETPTASGSRPFGELYSEPLVERLARLGGPVSRKVSQENLNIVSRAKQLYGELAATILDPAKQAAGRAFRGGTTWIHGLREITPNAAVSRFHDAIEIRARSGDWSHVPAEHQPLVAQLYEANLGIGQLAERANPAFRASGRLQRMLTSYGYDIVRRGKGAAWDAWSTALAQANNMKPESARAFLRRWKKELDAPGVDATHLDRIAQDFERHFPNAVTHIRPRRGLGWHEIIHSSPFSYLENAAQRTANAVAFREVYPLVQHEGKWVTSGKLEATRQAVQRELNTSRHGNEFDNVMRALQGHPLDTFTAWWNAPDTATGAALRTADAAMRPLRSLMLSASLPVNIGEALSGGAQIFLGYGRTFSALVKERRLYDDLKRSGMLNAAIRDFSFDPSQPARSLSRQSANSISRIFLSDVMNEFQEFSGAAAARVVANEIRSGTLPAREVQSVIGTMRAMGIDKASAESAVAGRNPAALQQFETKAAEFLSGGNKAMAEQSRWGASRAFTSLFWFHNYPMTKTRQLRSLLNNLIEDVQTRDIAQAKANGILLGRFIGGTTLGGAITTGVMRLIYEGLYGSKIQLQEAQDDFPGFVTEAIKMGMGGPVQIAARIFEQGAGTEAIGSVLLGSMAPVGVANELSDAVTGRGKYEGTDTFERIGLFLQSKTPIAKAIKQGMAATGLSQDDAALDAAIKGFYRWRRDEFGFVQRKAFLEDDGSRTQFRAAMRKAVEALKDGDLAEFDAQIDAALSDPETTMKQVKSSLRGRTLLKTPDGRAFSDEELDALRNRIGSDAVDRLEMFDEMLKAQAR